MTRFILIRHAMTDSVGVRLAGRTPGVLLNTAGLQQAETLAKELQQFRLDAVYSSPLERALQTAAAIAALQRTPVQMLDAFNEINFGDWTNVPIASLRSDPLFQQFNSHRSVTVIPKGETMQAVQDRCIQAFRSLNQLHDGSTIAIVSHADVIKMAIAAVIGLPIDAHASIEIGTASYSIVDWDQGWQRLILLNGGQLSSDKNDAVSDTTGVP